MIIGITGGMTIPGIRDRGVGRLGKRGTPVSSVGSVLVLVGGVERRGGGSRRTWGRA